MTYEQHCKDYFATLSTEQVDMLRDELLQMEVFVAAGDAMIHRIRSRIGKLMVRKDNLSNVETTINDVREEAEILKVLLSKCDHVWGTDGAHSNVYCKKCFVDKPAYLVRVDGAE